VDRSAGTGQWRVPTGWATTRPIGSAGSRRASDDRDRPVGEPAIGEYDFIVLREHLSTGMTHLREGPDGDPLV
jgi:hypothetical protein